MNTVAKAIYKHLLIKDAVIHRIEALRCMWCVNVKKSSKWEARPIYSWTTHNDIVLLDAVKGNFCDFHHDIAGML